MPLFSKATLADRRNSSVSQLRKRARAPTREQEPQDIGAATVLASEDDEALRDLLGLGQQAERQHFVRAALDAHALRTQRILPDDEQEVENLRRQRVNRAQRAERAR